MATKVKKGDFVELDFVGRIKVTGQIFDLTVEEIAKKENLNREAKFEPMVACIGSGQLIAGFDEQIDGKEVGEEFEFDLDSEKAFGKKNPKLIQLTSLQLLKKRNINPMTGMQLNIDGSVATVRSVSGGRVVLDFNHPLAGKVLHYWAKIRAIITDRKKQIEATVKVLGIPCEVSSLKENTATLKFNQEVPDQIKDMISKELEKQISGIKIKFN
jgi:FKBP-type peptidyl-prolyl cis-trans isomerase 2